MSEKIIFIFLMIVSGILGTILGLLTALFVYLRRENRQIKEALSWLVKNELAEYEIEKLEWEGGEGWIIDEKPEEVEMKSKEEIAKVVHEIYQKMSKKHGDKKYPDDYEELSDEVKEYDLTIAEYIKENFYEKKGH